MASAGEPFRGLSASDWAKARAAGQWYERQRRTSQPNQQTPIPRGAYPVLVKNATGSDLAAGACVELTGTALTAFDRDHLWFNGASRSGACPPFAILVAACPNGDYGEAVTCGEVLALVDVQDTDNTHARFTAGGTTLKGCFGGPVELLVKPTSTGSQMIPVRMGATQTIVRRAKAAEDITSGASGDVNVYLNGSSKGTITAYNDWDAGDVANNDELRIIYHHDSDKWEILTRGSGGSTAATPAWGCWTLGGSGYVFQDGSGSADTTPYQLTSSGLWLFGQARSAVRLTNELGTVFTVNSAGLSYDLDFIEIQQYGYYEITLHTTWLLPPLSLTNARNLMRVAGHTHSYTDDGAPGTTGTTTPDAASIDCGGVVRIQSEMYYGATSQVMGVSTLPVWYGSDEYQWMSHSDSFILPVTFTLRNLRFKVSRLDTTSYAAPEFSTATLVIKQLHPFDTSAL